MKRNCSFARCNIIILVHFPGGFWLYVSSKALLLLVYSRLHYLFSCESKIFFLYFNFHEIFHFPTIIKNNALIATVSLGLIWEKIQKFKFTEEKKSKKYALA